MDPELTSETGERIVAIDSLLVVSRVLLVGSRLLEDDRFKDGAALCIIVGDQLVRLKVVYGLRRRAHIGIILKCDPEVEWPLELRDTIVGIEDTGTPLGTQLAARYTLDSVCNVMAQVDLGDACPRPVLAGPAQPPGGARTESSGPLSSCAGGGGGGVAQPLGGGVSLDCFEDAPFGCEVADDPISQFLNAMTGGEESRRDGGSGGSASKRKISDTL